MEIIDVECSKLNRLYMKKNTEDFVGSFGDLIGPGRPRKEAEYLRQAKNPGLKAQIRVDTKGNYNLVSCVYETDCGVYCDFKKRI